MSRAVAEKYVNPAHIDAICQVARAKGVFILIRASNPDSVKYMGERGYVAKPLNCKAKTAKKDLPMPHRPGQMYRLAGLVVSPEIHPDAFDGRDVAKEWEETKKNVYFPEPGRPRVYLPEGKSFVVETDPDHKHYGCLSQPASGGLITAKRFIFGDYDLYAIVPADDVQTNRFVQEERLGTAHSRSPYLLDVQIHLNRLIGTPMVLHGSQETYRDHTDEDVVVFWPDGRTITEALGRRGIEELYRDTFKGRLAYSRNRHVARDEGLWVRT